MVPEVTLKPMTPEMYHAFFREYENDPPAAGGIKR